MKNQKKSDEVVPSSISDNRKPKGQAVVEFDFDNNEMGLDASQFTENEMDEFMDAVSDVMFAFVELGFGVHAVQLVDPEDDSQAKLAEMAKEYVKKAA